MVRPFPSFVQSAFALAALVWSLGSVAAIAQGPFTIRHSATGAGVLWDLVEGGNGLVAVGAIVTSDTLGATWTEHSPITAANLVGSGFGQQSLFVVGDHQTILQSQPIHRSYLANLSTRGKITREGHSLIAGLVIDGTAAKRFLTRAAGPSLGEFGVNNPSPAPRLRIANDQSETIAENAGWLSNPGHSEIASLAREIRAFPFANPSMDSAIAPTLGPGAFTAVVDGESDGIALVEFYDIDHYPELQHARFRNLSTRGHVGTGDDILIAGLAVRGTSAVSVLIRGIGPGLEQFGMDDTLGDPEITIYTADGTVFGRNDNWYEQVLNDSNDAITEELEVKSLIAGAFELAATSKDAAAILTLVPGAYTITLAGRDASIGEALLEVYHLP